MARSVLVASLLPSIAACGSETFQWGAQPGASDRAGVSPNGLVLHWQLDETDGRVAEDASGAEVDGTVVGDEYAWSPGEGIQGGAWFDGGSGEIQLRSSVLDDLGDSFTVAFWIRNTGLSGDFGSAVRVGSDAGGWNISRAGVSEDLRCRIDTDSANNQIVKEFPGVLDSEWHHLVLVIDGIRVRLYTDGAETGDDTYQPGSGLTQPNRLLRLADAHAEFPSFYDDLRFYDRPLDATEVQSLFRISEAE